MLSEILYIVHRLESNLSFIESIILWISHKLFDLDILKKFGENVNLLGFEDGVYDFTTREFRQGIKEDYITKSTGYDFPTQYNGKKHDDVF